MRCPKRTRFAISCGMFAVAITVSGCGIPLSTQPVSTEENSVVDERLLGVWQPVIPDEKPDGSNGESKQRGVFIFSKSGKSNQMLLTVFGVDDEMKVSAEHIVLLTSPGKVNYASFKVDADAFLITRYALESKGRILRIRGLDSRIIEHAIESGEVPGEVTRPPVEAIKPRQTNRGVNLGWKSIEINFASMKLRKYLDKHPNVFTDNAFELRKVSDEEIDHMLAVLDESRRKENTVDENETSINNFLWVIGLVAIVFLFGFGFGRIRQQPYQDQQNHNE